MARASVEIQPIKLFQIPNAAQRFFAERTLAVEGVQHDPFQQVSQRQVVVFRKTLQHFEQALFDAHASLHPFHYEAVVHLCIHGTNVPRYQPDASTFRHGRPKFSGRSFNRGKNAKGESGRERTTRYRPPATSCSSKNFPPVSSLDP